MPDKDEKSAIHKEMESLTIHGISRVASANNKYTRITWLVLCISATISFGTVAFESLIKYYQYHTFNHRTVRQNSKLALPAVTFCHANFYHPLMFLYNDPPVFQYFPENCSFNDGKYFRNEMNKKIFDFACKMFIGTLNSKTSAMGIEIPQYLRFPTGFELTPNKEPCITLNRNSTLVQQAAGEKYGLHMIMYNEYHNISLDSSEDTLLTDSRNGIYVMIHDPKQTIPMGDGIVIPPGYHTHISVTKNIFKRLPHPYPSKCINDWSNHDSIYPGKNTQDMCVSSCVIKQLYNMCPGVVPELKVFMKAPEFPVQANITNASYWQCILDSLTQLQQQHCDCSEYCDDETYTTVVNRNPWPQKWKAPSFSKLINRIEGKANQTLSTAEIRERLIRVSIYYQNIRENLWEEQPLYDLSTIASDLGGQMGLFMGASLLSLAEIIALVATYFKRNLSHCSKVKEVSPQPAN